MGESPEATRGEALGRERFETIHRVMKGADLYDIRTTATYARLRGDPPAAGVELSGAIAIDLTGRIREGEFQILGRFGIRAHEASKTAKDAFFSAWLDLVAYYRMKPGQSFTHAEIAPFAETNGMLHLWPYFRNFVQQSCGQFSIPSIVLPVFRAGDRLAVRYSSAD